MMNMSELPVSKVDGDLTHSVGYIYNYMCFLSTPVFKHFSVIIMSEVQNQYTVYGVHLNLHKICPSQCWTCLQWRRDCSASHKSSIREFGMSPSSDTRSIGRHTCRLTFHPVLQSTENPSQLLPSKLNLPIISGRSGIVLFPLYHYLGRITPQNMA